MDYEKSRKEFYQDELKSIAPQMAEILDAGYSLEVSRSRSGLKLYSASKKHVVLRRGSNNVSE